MILRWGTVHSKRVPSLVSSWVPLNMKTIGCVTQKWTFCRFQLFEELKFYAPYKMKDFLDCSTVYTSNANFRNICFKVIPNLLCKVLAEKLQRSEKWWHSLSRCLTGLPISHPQPARPKKSPAIGNMPLICVQKYFRQYSEIYGKMSIFVWKNLPWYKLQDLPIAKNWKISFVWHSIQLQGNNLGKNYFFVHSSSPHFHGTIQVKIFNLKNKSVIENCDPLVRDYHVTYNDGGKDLYQSQKIEFRFLDG